MSFVRSHSLANLHLHVVAQEESAEASRNQLPPRPCVLIVENELFPEPELAETVAKHGFDIAGPFNRAFKAIEWLETKTPQLAILDVDQWDGSSFDLAHELRARGVPFVFYTSWAEIEQIPPELRDMPFLEKPDHGLLIPRLLSKLIEGKLQRSVRE